MDDDPADRSGYPAVTAVCRKPVGGRAQGDLARGPAPLQILLRGIALGSKKLAEVSVKRIKEDVLDGQEGLLLAVELASPLGSPHVDPVRGAVAGSAEAIPLDERLQEDGLVPVADLPILGQAFGGEGQDPGGEVVGFEAMSPRISSSSAALKIRPQ